jgi:hypothetical protein
VGHSGVPRQLFSLFRGKYDLDAVDPSLNGMERMQGVLQPFSFTKLKIQHLESKMDEQVQILVAAHVSSYSAILGYQPHLTLQYERLLRESALAGAISVLNEHDPDVSLHLLYRVPFVNRMVRFLSPIFPRRVVNISPQPFRVSMASSPH